MSDPFDVLRSQLVRAAARAQAPSRRRWARLRGRWRPAVVLVVAVALSGSATAAVLSLSGSSSQPLNGRIPTRATVPGGYGPLSVAGYGYAIRVTPELQAGAAGWEVWTAYQAPGFGPGLGGGGGGGYPTRSTPVFQGSGVAPWNTSTGQNAGETVAFVLTGPQVAAVQVGERRIRTFTSPLLPLSDRAAVFFLAAGSPQVTVGWRPGQPIRSHTQIPVPVLSSSKQISWKTVTVATLALLPLDPSGRPVASSFPDEYASSYSFWQAPRAVTPNIHEPAYHGPTRPAPGACELGQRGLPALLPAWGATITRITPVRDALGELFLACVSTEYYLHNWPLLAAVLLDARHPGTVPGPIPGAQPVFGDNDLVDYPAASLSARRVGDAWLVVQGGSGTTQRLEALTALRITRLSLTHP